ncbi:exodeoxyribonuclease VII large subunit [Methanofollis formosanus]|uniref:Exodeoxyribonuclease VII large subunit n=1 Tax=Methanofollis formosanus TaxID=299308 RepID=A0A8G1A013_9EURY|nr:exodeoxyribonuclease VII large subunit [Methanofollis formosanus]QYZ78712.1 exodeoxyribonuclease VII large subunit [Methanofollis formosanus]
MGPAEGPDGPAVLGVAEVTGIIRDALDLPELAGLWVRGEVTNYTHHRSGHRYFSLGEGRGRDQALINAVMFRGSARALSFEPAEGMDVLAYGRVGVYGPQGKYQFYVEDMRLAGEGEKHLLVERWRRELAAEGCFETSRKRGIPAFPRRVAVVTSPTGAVLHDITNVLSRRYPLEVLLSPTAVQGETAHLEIAGAIRRADGLADVLIVGRGGGSFEDLFPFNRPEVVRAIAACETPVISAVGHEVDVTLADLAADLRAPTPSAAAECAVPDRQRLREDLEADRRRMRDGIVAALDRRRTGLEDLRLRLRPARPLRRVAEVRQQTADLEERLFRAASMKIKNERLVLTGLKATLDGKNPYAPLRRGYALALRDGEVVRSAGALGPGDRLDLLLADGRAGVVVESVHDDEDVRRPDP